MAPLFLLARQGRVFEVIAFVFMFATIFFLLLESLRPGGGGEWLIFGGLFLFSGLIFLIASRLLTSTDWFLRGSTSWRMVCRSPWINVSGVLLRSWRG
jgi:hypothetical protein